MASTRVMDEDITPPEARRIRPAAVRYIKLGEKGALAETCIREGLVILQHTEVAHDLANHGDWNAVREILARLSDNTGTVTRWLGEIRDFYEAAPETLWITFHSGFLWWGFAEHGTNPTEPALLPGGRSRRIASGWKNTDLAGNPLHIDHISTDITRTAGFRSTICKVPAADRLIRLINGEENPAVIEARNRREAFEASLVGIIRSLHQNDFELLTDLIFHRLGWQRIGALGGPQADTDLVLIQPATGQRALVQVKSSASQDVVEDYGNRFAGDPDALPFLICHSPRGILTAPAGREDMIIWDGNMLARKVSEAGLTDWLLGHAA